MTLAAQSPTIRPQRTIARRRIRNSAPSSQNTSARNAHTPAIDKTFGRALTDPLPNVTGRLEQAGPEVRATVLQEPEFDHETTRQAFVIARRQ
jgi:hypothetical protein